MVLGSDMVTSKKISLILVTFLCINSVTIAFDSVKEYETSILKIMDQDWKEEVHRAMRQKRQESSGDDLVCPNTDAVTCTIESQSCICNCNSGYYSNATANEDDCIQVKTFGGAATFVNIDDTTTEKNIEDALRVLYENDKNFVDLNLLSTDPSLPMAKSGQSYSKSVSRQTIPSLTANFELFYSKDADVNETTINNAVTADVCSCSGADPTTTTVVSLPMTTASTPMTTDTTGAPVTTETSDIPTTTGISIMKGATGAPISFATDDCLAGTLKLDRNATCAGIINSDYSCNSTIGNICDDVTTDCQSSPDGSVKCLCKSDGLVESNDTSCYEVICVEDGHCNSPFGWCKNNKCTCMWGFDGATCHQPWKFALTVVGSGCGLIIIVLIIVVIVCRKKGKSKSRTSDEREQMSDSQNPFSDFQPSIMRAKLPSRTIYSSVSDGPPGGSPDDQAFSTTTFNARQRNDDGRTNYGYIPENKAKRASSKYGSPNDSNSYF